MTPHSSKLNFENGSFYVNTGILFGIPVALRHEILGLPQELGGKGLGPKEGCGGYILSLAWQ